MNFDKIILGGGIYGLYAATTCVRKGQHILVLEYDKEPFLRASYINQARVHNGYHYPRSFATASKSASYFRRFHEDFGFCINSSFKQIYATSKESSWTNAQQFKKFCDAASIYCEEIDVNKYFNSNVCDGAFLTEEDTYDAQKLKEFFIKELNKNKNVCIKYGTRIKSFESDGEYFKIRTGTNAYKSKFVLNATYASINQLLYLLNYDLFQIKYEICEIILCKASESLRELGITVMDGPFFSVMPFGMTQMHSLTSVMSTPHESCFTSLPQFQCMEKSKGKCDFLHLDNCNNCHLKPKTAYPYMRALSMKYLNPIYDFKYKSSLFSVKPILLESEIDDSRPTVIKIHSVKPTFISVLSGKVNTIYDLDEILD